MPRCQKHCSDRPAIRSGERYGHFFEVPLNCALKSVLLSA